MLEYIYEEEINMNNVCIDRDEEDVNMFTKEYLDFKYLNN